MYDPLAFPINHFFQYSFSSHLWIAISSYKFIFNTFLSKSHVFNSTSLISFLFYVTEWWCLSERVIKMFV